VKGLSFVFLSLILAVLFLAGCPVEPTKGPPLLDPADYSLALGTYTQTQGGGLSVGGERESIVELGKDYIKWGTGASQMVDISIEYVGRYYSYKNAYSYNSGYGDCCYFGIYNTDGDLVGSIGIYLNEAPPRGSWSSQVYIGEKVWPAILGEESISPLLNIFNESISGTLSKSLTSFEYKSGLNEKNPITDDILGVYQGAGSLYDSQSRNTSFKAGDFFITEDSFAWGTGFDDVVSIEIKDGGKKGYIDKEGNILSETKRFTMRDHNNSSSSGYIDAFYKNDEFSSSVCSIGDIYNNRIGGFTGILSKGNTDTIDYIMTLDSKNYLCWNSTGAASYNVYGRNYESAPWNYIKNTTNTYCSLYGISTYYYYRVEGFL
jgi:hypothetical protein